MITTKAKKLTVKQIADMIKAGQWAKTKKVDVVDFFTDMTLVFKLEK